MKRFLKHCNSAIGQGCIVCHGCYDAPCQLKLTADEFFRLMRSRNPSGEEGFSEFFRAS